MPNYTDKQRQQIANEEYNPKNRIGKRLRIKQDNTYQTIGYISDIINDNTGQNAFVITDTRPNVSNKQVKQVTVLYRGSSFDLSPDAKRDWLNNDIPAALNVLSNGDGKPTQQLVAASQTLDKMMAKYPNAQFEVYGHSLGSMNGQYAVANLATENQKRLAGGYFYEGPNVYKMLNERQRANAKALNKTQRIFNYHDAYDLVPLGYGSGKKTVGIDTQVLTKKLGDPIQQHMWGGYKFNENDSLLVSPDTASDYATIQTSQKLNQVSALQAKFMAGGALSAGQEQLLDEYEALARVEGMQTIVDSQLGDLQMVYEEAIDEARALWQITRQQAESIGPNLSRYEQEAALDEGGVTEETIKTKPIQEYKESIHNIQKVQKEYQELHQQIKDAIEHQKDTDEEMAQQIKDFLW